MASASKKPKNGKASSPHVLPDPTICRAQLYGTGVLVECLVDDPSECPHALAYADVFFCEDPQRKVIVARTKAEQDKKNS